jgi:hypothetical protein
VSRKSATNPFYTLVVLTGLAFVLTAVFHVATLVRSQPPARVAANPSTAHPFAAFFERRGEWLLLWEAVTLAAVSLLAMGLDRWRSWHEARHRADPQGQFPMSPSSES